MSQVQCKSCGRVVPFLSLQGTTCPLCHNDVRQADRERRKAAERQNASVPDQMAKDDNYEEETEEEVQAAKSIPPKKSKARRVGSIPVDGKDVDIFEDEQGRRWFNHPKPFRLYEEMHDYLWHNGAYKYDRLHFVIDRPDGGSIYIQVHGTGDGRLQLIYVEDRGHWPPTVTWQAQKMYSTVQENLSRAASAIRNEQQFLNLASGAAMVALAVRLFRK